MLTNPYAEGATMSQGRPGQPVTEGVMTQNAAWLAYQERLGNLTTREENAIEHAFKAGWHRLGMIPMSITIWQGQCGVCKSCFQHPETSAENPSPSGTFCPVCRDEQKMTAPGVVHWKAKVASDVYFGRRTNARATV